MSNIYISTRNPEEARLIVYAAQREGYQAEIRNGYAYFPDLFWRFDPTRIIERDRLAVSWSDQHCTVAGNGFTATGHSLNEAVLRHLADRPHALAA